MVDHLKYSTLKFQYIDSPHFIIVGRQIERERHDGLLVERGDHELPRLLHDGAGARRLRINHSHLDKVENGLCM